MAGENLNNNTEEVELVDGISELAAMSDTFDPEQAAKNRQEAEEKLEIIKKQRLVWAEAIRLNPNLIIEDESRGLYSFETSDGIKVFGSVYSILDMHEDLGAMGIRAEAIRSKSGDDSLMGIEVSEGAGYESVVVASGSFAQREVNPYPADMDFAEHLKITANDEQESGRILSSLLSSTIERTSQEDDTVFTELKVGTYPPEAGELSGKSVKWSLSEIQNGEKRIRNGAGDEIVINFQEACTQPGSMIKIDWLTNINGQVKEMTKVINLTVQTPGGDEIFNNSQKSSAFQEIYFGDPSSFGITEQTLEPDVSEEYLNFLRRDVGKYSAPGHENFLKVAKRSYNFLKCSGLVDEARELAPLFKSSISELASRSESLGLLPDFIEENAKNGNQVDISQFSDSFNKLIQNVDVLAREGSIPADDRDNTISNISSLSNMLINNPQEAKQRIGQLTEYFRSIINEGAKKYLSGVNLPQKIMI